MSVNKVILIGRLGQSPELKMTANNFPVCNISIATSERKKDASGNWVEHTEWHRVVTLGRTAELCSQYLSKGREVYIEGRLQTRKWQDKEGKDRYTTEIVADSVKFLGSKNSNAEAGGAQASYSSNTAAAAAGNELLSSLESADSIAAQTTGGASPAATFSDDDIPF